MAEAPVSAAGPAGLVTEFEFRLPLGVVDESGAVNRDGTMRLATARDEILPLRDPRVRDNDAYLTVLLLSRVVTRIGAINSVSAATIENLYAPDLAFLQDLYRRVNQEGHAHASVQCPNCNSEFTVDVAGGSPGES